MSVWSGWPRPCDSPLVGRQAQVHRLVGGFQNGSNQGYHSRTISLKWLPSTSLLPKGGQFPPVSSGHSLRPAVRSDSGFFQTLVSELGLGASEILCAAFEYGSVSHDHLALPNISPADLQSQTFLGFIFVVQDPWAGELWTPHCVGRTNAIVIILPLVGCLPQEYGSWLYHVFTPYTCVTVVLSFRSFLLVFKLFLSTVAL